MTFDIMEFSMEAKAEKKKGSDSPAFTMEDALIKIGGFSKFQILMILIFTFIDYPNAMLNMNSILTTTAQVKWSCLDADGGQTDISQDDLCTYNCSGEIVPSGQLPYNSIVQEWKLICDKSWVSDAIISLHMFGGLIGCIVVAYCSDRFGRKKAFYTNTFFMGLSGILSAVATDPIFFAVSRFISGFLLGGAFTSHFNYLMEFLPPKWRQICGCVSFWSIGEMSLALLGYLIPSWRTLSWVTPFPAMIVFLTVMFVPESPRWALANGQYKTAEKALQKISRWNSKPELSPGEFKLLEATVQREASEEKEMTGAGKTLLAFTDFQLLRILLAFCLIWFANAAIYFGLSYNMKNMSGDPYWNIFFLGLVDLPAELSGFYFSNRFGRRRSFITTLLISSLILVGVVAVEIFIPNEIPSLTLILCLAGKFFIQSSWAVMACFTSESFPTVCRSFSMSVCAGISTIGAMMAPQLLSSYIPKAVPYVVFAGLAILSSLVGLTIPEMNGRPLADS